MIEQQIKYLNFIIFVHKNNLLFRLGERLLGMRSRCGVPCWHTAPIRQVAIWERKLGTLLPRAFLKKIYIFFVRIGRRMQVLALENAKKRIFKKFLPSRGVTPTRGARECPRRSAKIKKNQQGSLLKFLGEFSLKILKKK